MKGIITGYNFLFGKNASGNVQTLAELAKQNNWECIAVDGVFLPDGRRISSSEMRKAMHWGNLDEYKKLRGDFYTCVGNVKKGKRLGRTIGFPTLNLPWNPDCKLPYGAYVVELMRCKTGETFKGVASYGTSPTISETEPLLEVHLFKNIKWGAPSKVSVKIKKFLRPQKKFSSLEALIEQLHKDVKLAKVMVVSRCKSAFLATSTTLRI